MEPGEWTARRRLDGGQVDPEALVAARASAGLSVSVCLPARDCEATVGAIVTALRESWVTGLPLIDEVLVIDGFSSDRTRARATEAGAAVHGQGELVPDARGGKGEAMWAGLGITSGDVVCFVDADILDFDPGFLPGMLAPILTDRAVSLVKAAYTRSLGERPTDGGRVTELCARPLLGMFFPELAEIRQPLAGETAGRRALLERLPFVDGYGVEVGLLIDAWRLVGLDGLAEVDLGHRDHHNQSTAALGAMARVVAQTILGRAGLGGSIADPLPLTERPPRR